MTSSRSPLTRWLETAPLPVFTAVAMTAGFSTYFCMYGFRKPFSAAEYRGLTFLGGPLALKSLFIMSQIVGYTVSKFIGIKVCSEVPRSRRVWMLLGMILAAEGALVLFAVLPPDWKPLALFLNGLPLGMVWGLVVWYLEGRRTSELLLAALSCSYIVSTAAVKDVGLLVLNRLHQWDIAEFWMPAATGLCFLPLFVLSVYVLNRLPPPTPLDVALRVKRAPMDGRDRLHFIRELLLGLFFLLLMFFFLTAYREVRDTFGVEIFRELGYLRTPGLFTMTEIPVGLGVMAALAGLNFVRNNRLALLGAHLLMVGGLLLVGVATLLLDGDLITGQLWMILIGLGTYLAYVPHGAVVFDRMIASTRVAGTAVFAIYLADAIGYSGAVGVVLFKDSGFVESFSGLHDKVSWLVFFRVFTYALSVGGTLCLLASAAYFWGRHQPTGLDQPIRNLAMPASEALTTISTGVQGA